MPRSLTLPPGIPDFCHPPPLPRPGPCRLEGRAWSGWAPVERVEVSADDGATWDRRASSARRSATARGAAGRYDWDATAGEPRDLLARDDGAGNVQPVAADWNLKGFANNAGRADRGHRPAVTVTVTAQRCSGFG